MTSKTTICGGNIFIKCLFSFSPLLRLGASGGQGSFSSIVVSLAPSPVTSTQKTMLNA